MNLYGFAGGDPINFKDPFGLCVPPATVVCVGWVLAGVATAGIAAWQASKLTSDMTTPSDVTAQAIDWRKVRESIGKKVDKLVEIGMLAGQLLGGDPLPPKPEPPDPNNKKGKPTSTRTLVPVDSSSSKP